jgi:uncharacterized protein
MFKTASGEEIFVIDAHIHQWDGSPENQLNKHGEEFISCFYDYHRNLSPKEYVQDYNKFRKMNADDIINDVFVKGYADMAIFQPVGLKEFYKNGFGNFEGDYQIAQKYKNRFINNGSYDPRHGENGLKKLEENARKYGWKGIKLYTAEWHGESKGYKLSDDCSKRYLEKCIELGIKNIHVHKGPTLTPLNKDAFDVGDVDDVASTYTELNFIVEHCGLPRLEDFCWIATQEKNVYAGLSVAMPFIHGRPRYFAEIISELLYWLDEDRLIYSSDYALWEPKWILEKFIDFELPDDIAQETGVTLDLNVKKKILAGNIARLYNIDIEKQKEQFRNDALAVLI